MSGKVKETKAVWGRWSVACHSAGPAGFKGMPGTAKHAGRWSNPPPPPQADGPEHRVGMENMLLGCSV